MAGVFITAFYSFRMYFLVFHGEERFGKAHDAHHSADAKHHDDDEHQEDAGDAHAHHHGLKPGQKPHETPWVVTLPLVLLAIPSVVIGYIAVEPMLFGGFFKEAIYINAEAHPVLQELAHEFHGATAMALHSIQTPVFWLAVSGVALSWFFYMKRPDIPAAIKQASGPIYTVLENKYFFDKFNEVVLAGGAKFLGRGLWRGGDVGVIDGLVVGGAIRLVSGISMLARFFQSGHIYHYAFTMIFGVCALLSFWLLRA